MNEQAAENGTPPRKRVEESFDMLIATCPLLDPIGLNNRELAISAMSAALGSGDAELADRVAEALRFVGQDWMLRAPTRVVAPSPVPDDRDNGRDRR